VRVLGAAVLVLGAAVLVLGAAVLVLGAAQGPHHSGILSSSSQTGQCDRLPSCFAAEARNRHL
jgi:hypothetical protein